MKHPGPAAASPAAAPPAAAPPPTAPPRRAARSSGQASIELVAALPLCIAIALGAGQLVAAGAARELAATAAQAGAMAMLQGGDPKRAARAAVPDWSKDRVEVRVTDRAVRVRIRPVALIPGTAQHLVATADADAGPRP